ncbi:hypothetical protein [Roseospira navarrensis]|uniref:Sel1 repeat family protein n=1 Tax=Roseospira navarrensis TaxID=140058 RepID=A0A7X2D453_9PROT|nr:hypothetical protein [Roseospira navarrensis]MQX37491.1 hypothetical protein [Roseospira navarrensis]
MTRALLFASVLTGTLALTASGIAASGPASRTLPGPALSGAPSLLWKVQADGNPEQACRSALERAGVTPAQGGLPILGPDGSERLDRFVCDLAANGHEVTSVESLDDGRTRMKILEGSGAFIHVTLDMVEALPNQTMLVGQALGDANSQPPITVADWQAYVGGLMTGGAIDAETARARADDCDALAGDPDDPQRAGPGVPAESVDVQAAYDACYEAVAGGEQAPRLLFQLGRVLLLGGYTQDAVAPLIEAADQDHAAAKGYLAELVAQGAGGLEPDPELAQGLHQQAAAAGFAPSTEILEASQAATALDYDRFNRPDLIRALHQGDKDAFWSARSGLMMEEHGAPLTLIHYFTTFVEQMRNPYHGMGCPGSMRAGIIPALERRALTTTDPMAGLGGMMSVLEGIMQDPGVASGDPRGIMAPIVEGEATVETLREAGGMDALALVRTFDCNDPAMQTILSNLDAFVREGP